MTKKGFTLIELLAVILILGIIALIAIPTVNNIINESKRNSFKATVQNVAKAAETKCQLERLKGEEQTATYTFSNAGVSPSLDMKGKLPTSGTITVDNECNTSFSNLTDGKYVATKTATSNHLVITEVDEESPKLCQATIGDGTHIGDVITCGTESFYVYDTTGDSIKMLSKYNLKVGGVFGYSASIDNYDYTPYIESEITYMQDVNMRGRVVGQDEEKGVTQFSSEDQHGAKYNDYEGSIVEEYVNEYKEKLEEMGLNLINASLITKEELESLGCSFSDYSCTNSPYSWLYETSYWILFEDENPLDVWFLDSYGSLSVSDNYIHIYSESEMFGVRPVIVISKNEI